MKQLLERLLRDAVGPSTRLGRWCTPSYDARCDAALKAVLNSRDHSLYTRDMSKPCAPRGASEEDSCPWSNPTLTTFLYGR